MFVRVHCVGALHPFFYSLKIKIMLLSNCCGAELLENTLDDFGGGICKKCHEGAEFCEEEVKEEKIKHKTDQ